MSYLFIARNAARERQEFKAELRRSVLSYMEKEETFPDNLVQLKSDLNLKRYNLSYEIISDGTACLIKIDGKEEIELWLSK
jgi:hypothetical protein